MREGSPDENEPAPASSESTPADQLAIDLAGGSPWFLSLPMALRLK